MEKKEEKKKPSGSFSEVWEKRGQETDAANDFRKKIEMEITEARPGYAVGEIVLKPWHMNILGIVHGGVLYSLADTVGGGRHARLRRGGTVQRGRSAGAGDTDR